MSNHFVEDGFQPRQIWLDDGTYGQALDSLVISCADVIVISFVKGAPRILLGKRAYLPMQGWWIFGGRRQPGESPQESCARNMKREIGLELAPARFALLQCYSFAWANRRQAPPNHGSHTDSWTHCIILTDDEINQLRLNEEYEGSKWVTIPEMVDPESGYHEAIRQMGMGVSYFLAEH